MKEITELLDRLEFNLIALEYAEEEFFEMGGVSDAKTMNREAQATLALLKRHGRLTWDYETQNPN